MYMLIVQRGYLSCVGEGGFNGPESPEIALSSVFSGKLERGLLPFFLHEKVPCRISTSLLGYLGLFFALFSLFFAHRRSTRKISM